MQTAVAAEEVPVTWTKIWTYYNYPKGASPLVTLNIRTWVRRRARAILAPPAPVHRKKGRLGLSAHDRDKDAGAGAGAGAGAARLLV